MRVHVRSDDEIVLGSFRAKVYDVLDKILDVTYFARHAIDDFTEQLYLSAVLLAYIGDVDYGRNCLRR